jgi:hypothetical protein
MKLRTHGLIAFGLTIALIGAGGQAAFGATMGSLIDQASGDVDIQLIAGSTLGQGFTEDGPFNAVSVRLGTNGAASPSTATLSLYVGGPGGTLVKSQTFTSVTDGDYQTMDLSSILPGAGNYYLELSSPSGWVGWWTTTADTYGGGTSYGTGAVSGGDREFRVTVAGAEIHQTTQNSSASVPAGSTLGQTFTSTGSFYAVDAPFTVSGTAAVTISLKSGGPTGSVVVTQSFTGITSSRTLTLNPPSPLPGAGVYYLEAASATGTITWPSNTTDVYSGGTAYSGGATVAGDREFSVDVQGLAINQRVSSANIQLIPGSTLGQSFTETGSFRSVAVKAVTSGTAGLTLKLYTGSPSGTVIASKVFTGISNLSWLSLDVPAPLPSAGVYYIEESAPSGTIYWPTTGTDVYPGGTSFGFGSPSGGDRVFAVQTAIAAPATYPGSTNSGVTSGFAVGSTGVVLSRTDGSDFSYNYAPSILVDGTTVKMWWCGHGTNGGDNVFYSTRPVSSTTWGTPQQVLAPTGTTWESTFVCDPSVVKGSWTVGGTTYTYAMYYGGAGSVPAGTAVGVAFSNDGVSWTRNPSNPILTEPTGGYDYGDGFAAVISNSGSAVTLAYYDSEGQKNTFVATSTDGINFTNSYLLPVGGLESFGDLAYSTADSRWFLATKDQAAQSDRAVYIYESTTSNVQTSDWRYIGAISEATTGFYENHNPGWYRNSDGTLYTNGSGQHIVSFGAQVGLQTVSDPNTWQLAEATVSGTFATVSAPGAFSLSSPANAATVNPNLPASFSWSSSIAATSYEIEIATSSSFTAASMTYEGDVHATAYANLPTSFSLATLALNPSTTYWWRVVAVNGAGAATATSRSFTTASSYTINAVTDSRPLGADPGATVWSTASGLDLIEPGGGTSGLRFGVEFAPARVQIASASTIGLQIENRTASTSLTVNYKLMSEAPSAAWHTVTLSVSANDTAFHTYSLTMTGNPGWGAVGAQISYLQIIAPQAGDVLFKQLTIS